MELLSVLPQAGQWQVFVRADEPVDSDTEARALAAMVEVAGQFRLPPIVLHLLDPDEPGPLGLHRLV